MAGRTRQALHKQQIEAGLAEVAFALGLVLRHSDDDMKAGFRANYRGPVTRIERNRDCGLRPFAGVRRRGGGGDLSEILQRLIMADSSAFSGSSAALASARTASC
jgi:hypothetical protein